MTLALTRCRALEWEPRLSPASDPYKAKENTSSLWTLIGVSSAGNGYANREGVFHLVLGGDAVLQQSFVCILYSYTNHELCRMTIEGAMHLNHEQEPMFFGLAVGFGLAVFVELGDFF